jgi:hypothetical protein
MTPQHQLLRNHLFRVSADWPQQHLTVPDAQGLSHLSFRGELAGIWQRKGQAVELPRHQLMSDGWGVGNYRRHSVCGHAVAAVRY